MSYILEALKKSQQERELGRVPTLEATGTFEEDKVVPARSHWPMLAVGLAVVAMILALYAALRGPGSAPASTPPVIGDTTTSGLTLGAEPAPARDQADVTAAHGPPQHEASPAPSTRTPPGLVAAGRKGPPGSLAQVSPRAVPKDSVTAPGQVLEPLIEPPPLKQTERARSAEPIGDLGYGRGPQGSALQPPDATDLEAELEMQRQLEADYVEPWDEEYADPVPTPVPRDLIADIESFKREVRAVSDAEKTSAKASPKPIDDDPRSLRLTSAQEADLPPYLMTVHVYDADKGRRFVMINGRKYREGDKTREGMSVERIVAEGAVLSYKGNPFFVPR